MTETNNGLGATADRARYQIETNRIRKYLNALEAIAESQFRGRKTRNWVVRQIEELPDRIKAEKDPVKKLLLVQDLLDRENDLERMPTLDDLVRLEDEFIAVAKSFSDRKGVTYAAWRHVRVEPDVLERAGIKRGVVMTAREDLIGTLGKIGDLLHNEGTDPSDPGFYEGLADGLPTVLLRRVIRERSDER